MSFLQMLNSEKQPIIPGKEKMKEDFRKESLYSHLKKKTWPPGTWREITPKGTFPPLIPRRGSF